MKLKLLVFLFFGGVLIIGIQFLPKEMEKIESENKSEAQELSKDQSESPGNHTNSRKEDPISSWIKSLPGSMQPVEPTTQAQTIEKIIRPETSWSQANLQAVKKDIRKLRPTELSMEEKESLRWLLTVANVDESIRNDVAVVLIKAGYFPVLGTAGAGLYDLKQTDLWRNYCVQFLAVGYRKLEQKSEIIDILLHSAKTDKSEIVRDAAMLHVSRFAMENEWALTQEKWWNRTLTLIDSLVREGKTSTDQISGIRAAAELGQTKYVPEWLDALKSKEAKIEIKKAIVPSLVSLTKLLDVEKVKELKLALEEVNESQNPDLRKLAEAGLKKLSEKNKSN